MCACALVRACVYVIGSLPALTWLAVAPSWQGAGRCWPDGMGFLILLIYLEGVG